MHCALRSPRGSFALGIPTLLRTDMSCQTALDYDLDRPPFICPRRADYTRTRAFGAEPRQAACEGPRVSLHSRELHAFLLLAIVLERFEPHANRALRIGATYLPNRSGFGKRPLSPQETRDARVLVQLSSSVKSIRPSTRPLPCDTAPGVVDTNDRGHDAVRVCHEYRLVPGARLASIACSETENPRVNRWAISSRAPGLRGNDSECDTYSPGKHEGILDVRQQQAATTCET